MSLHTKKTLLELARTIVSAVAVFVPQIIMAPDWSTARVGISLAAMAAINAGLRFGQAQFTTLETPQELKKP